MNNPDFSRPGPIGGLPDMNTTGPIGHVIPSAIDSSFPENMGECVRGGSERERLIDGYLARIDALEKAVDCYKDALTACKFGWIMTGGLLLVVTAILVFVSAQ